MKSVKEIRSEFDRRKGKQQQIDKSLKAEQTTLSDQQKKLHRHEQAREIIKEVGLKTQQALALHISDITNLAMQSVFDPPYEMVVNFIERRNKTECDLLFKRGDNLIDPLNASGGGPADIASFALRIACWSMQRPRNRPVILLDEPMHFLSRDLQPKASEMIKQLSEKLGLQFIIITHDEDLTTNADRTFEVSIRNGVTKVE